MEHLFLMFLDHTQRRSTVGRTPLDEWSARRRDLYLTTHDTHNRQISMPPVGFEPKISAGERPGPVCEGAIWRSRYNEELYRLYDETDLVTTIRITRLRWAGHIVWMPDNLPCKKITLDKPEGRRRVGRPNLRWMDGVMRDAERLGVRNWKSKA